MKHMDGGLFIGAACMECAELLDLRNAQKSRKREVQQVQQETCTHDSHKQALSRTDCSLRQQATGRSGCILAVSGAWHGTQGLRFSCRSSMHGVCRIALVSGMHRRQEKARCSKCCRRPAHTTVTKDPSSGLTGA